MCVMSADMCGALAFCPPKTLTGKPSNQYTLVLLLAAIVTMSLISNKMTHFSAQLTMQKQES